MSLLKMSLLKMTTATTLGLSLLTLAGCNTSSSTNANNAAAQSANTASADASAPASVLDPKFSDCQKQFFDKNQPKITAKLAKDSYPLCFDGFAVMYSGVSKTPIWVAEYLTRQRLTAAKNLPRTDNFHEEPRLPKDRRSLLNDYTNSGYDRGHLAPNADMANPSSQSDSFSLANIAPQAPENNRKTWVKIETQTRNLTQKYGASYVVTGVAYLTSEVKRLKNRVLVPSHFFKAIYIPSQNQAIAFLSPNDNSDTVEKISLSTLKKRTGVDAFPNLPANTAPIAIK